MEPPELALPSSPVLYTVYVDAKDKQIGCVLLQKHLNATERSVRYWFRLLSDAEWAHNSTSVMYGSITGRFAVLALFWGCRLTFCTDHDGLKWVWYVEDLTGKLVGCRLRLSKTEFEVVHRSRTKHQAADAKLLLRTWGTRETSLGDYILMLGVVAFSQPEEEDPLVLFT